MRWRPRDWRRWLFRARPAAGRRVELPRRERQCEGGRIRERRAKNRASPACCDERSRSGPLETPSSKGPGSSIFQILPEYGLRWIDTAIDHAHQQILIGGRGFFERSVAALAL